MLPGKENQIMFYGTLINPMQKIPGVSSSTYTLYEYSDYHQIVFYSTQAQITVLNNTAEAKDYVTYGSGPADISWDTPMLGIEVPE